MGSAYDLTTNDGGGRKVIVTIDIETGDGTFLSLHVEGDEEGEELLDLIGTDEAIRGFFTAVEEARQAWLKVTGMSKWTVVQHSGFGYSGKPGWARAVETRSLARGQEKAVLAAGGVVFDDYLEAEDFCEAANYPAGVSAEQLQPVVSGEFAASVKVDGLAVYIPRRIIHH